MTREGEREVRDTEGERVIGREKGLSERQA